MSIFIKTNDTTAETVDIFQFGDSSYRNLSLPIGDMNFWNLNYRGGYLYALLDNELHMFKTESNSQQENHYNLVNFHRIYDLLTDTWSEDLHDLPSELINYIYVSLFIASDSNRIYFCFNGDVTSQASTGGTYYKKYSHALYGYDFENEIIDYTNIISSTRIYTNIIYPGQPQTATLDALSQWNIKSFSSDSILLNSMGVSRSSGSSSTYSSNIYGYQQRLNLLSNVETSRIIAYYEGFMNINIKSDSWKYPHILYDDGLEVWITDKEWCVKENGIIKINPLPNMWMSGQEKTGRFYNKVFMASATVLKDQLHFFYYNTEQNYKSGYYNYTFKSNDPDLEKFTWRDGDKAKVDNIVVFKNSTTPTLRLYYTFEYDNALYSMSTDYNNNDPHFRKIYSKSEQTFTDGTHGKIKGIWVKVKKTVQDANGNYEVTEEPKRVTKIWVRTGNNYNSYKRIYW